MRTTADQHTHRYAVDHLPALVNPAAHASAQDSLSPPIYDVHRSNDDYTEEASYSSSYDESTETSIIAPSNAPHFLRMPMPNFSASKGASDLNATWHTFNALNPISAGAPLHDQLDDAFSESTVPHTLSVLTRWSGAYHSSPRQLAPRQTTVIATSELVTHEQDGVHRVHTHDEVGETPLLSSQQSPPCTRRSTPIKGKSTNAQATSLDAGPELAPCATPRAKATRLLFGPNKVVQDHGDTPPPLSPQMQAEGNENCNTAIRSAARRTEGRPSAGAESGKMCLTSQHALTHTPSHRSDIPRIMINVPRRPLACTVPHTGDVAARPQLPDRRISDAQAAHSNPVGIEGQAIPTAAVRPSVVHDRGGTAVAPKMPSSPSHPARARRRRAGMRPVRRQEVNICLVEYPVEGGDERGAANHRAGGADGARPAAPHDVVPPVGLVRDAARRSGRSSRPERCPSANASALPSHLPPTTTDQDRYTCHPQRQRLETGGGCTCNPRLPAERSTSARTPLSLAITASYRGTSIEVTGTKSSSMDKDAPPP